VKVSLTGENLKAMGITPGPRYKKILADLLDAKLDGLIKNEAEEVFFVRKKTGLLRE
jgi:tRNA nucleotidyltransferase (CCA-adding enzyme)